MDGENNGKPYFLMDDLGVKPTIFGNTHIYIIYIYTFFFYEAGGQLISTKPPVE